MRNIKNTLIAVTADWCSACHSISGRLNNAIKNSNNATRIDETLLDKFNSTLKTSIQPPHFPYFIVINQSGKMVKVLRDIDAVEQFLENASNEGTGDPESLSMSTSAMNKNINAVINNNNNSFKKNNVNSLMANSKKNNNEKMNTVMNSINQSMKKSFSNNNNNEEDEDEENDMDPNKISIVPDNTGLPMKMESVGVPNVGKGPSASLMNVSNSNMSNANSPMNSSNSNMSNANSPMNVSNSMKNATRPNAMSDARMNAANPANLSNSAKQAGGCLYESLAASAYNLATPAALLGIAAATLSKKKARKTKRRSRSA
jgi:hypothetical protein